jgi:hypothetical protein
VEWRVKSAKDGGRRGGSEVGEGKGREGKGCTRNDRNGKGRGERSEGMARGRQRL